MKWRPIETAPTDMDEVILYAASEDPPVFTAMFITDKWHRISGDVWATDNRFTGDPTFIPSHWMPLPNPPK